MKVRLEWQRRDCWVGWFWKVSHPMMVAHQKVEAEEGRAIHYWSPIAGLSGEPMTQYDLWVCLIPCVPIHLTWFKKGWVGFGSGLTKKEEA